MPNTVKTWVSASKLAFYDEKIKQYLATKDAAVLAECKKYFDDNKALFDAAGTAETVKQELTTLINALDARVEANKTAVEKAQGEVDALEVVVGTLPEGETDVISYIVKRTTGIASTDAMETLQATVTQQGKDIDAVEELVASNKTELEGKIATEATSRDNADKAIEAKIGTVAEGKTVVGLIDEAKQAAIESATYDDAPLKARVEANETAITKLNGNAEVEGSVDNKIAQAVAKIIENPDETMNSINELVTWINSHATEALELSNLANQNATDIAALEALVGETAVATQITDAIAAALKVEGVDKYALATDLTAAIARIAAMEAKVANWDAAEQNAKDYADGLDTAMDTRVKALENAVGESGSVAEDIEAAKQAAITASNAYTDEAKAALQTNISGKVAQADHNALAQRVTTAEGEIDTLQSEMDAVEAKAAKNETDLAALTTEVGKKANTETVNAIDGRLQTVEAEQAKWSEISEAEISALFESAQA